MMLMEGVRKPHQSIEAEQAVLGSIFFDPQKMDIANEELKAVDFYYLKHQIIFDCMVSLYLKGEEIDPVTVTNELVKMNKLESIGGVSYLTKLAEATPTAENIKFYIKIVKEKAVLRKLVKTCQTIIEDTYTFEDDLTKVIDDAEKKIMEVSPEVKNNDLKPMREVLIDAFEQLESLSFHNGEVTGIKTGFKDLDRITTGFQKGDFIIIAARPSVGKTAFALNVATNAAKFSKQNVAIFSLEMSSQQLTNRIISAEGNIDSQRIRTGDLKSEDWANLSYVLGELSNLGVYIDDTAGITVSEIRSKCRRLKQNHGLGMIVIDYLQLISPSTKRENRQQEVSEISRSLKLMAKELDVPVIALSQLSRGVESRQDKRPMLSDMRESGSLEQDADVVAFLYRDDYYNRESELKNIIEIIVAKQRNGPTGTIELGFLKEYNKFTNLDFYHKEES